jgi:hypothetical protein
MKERRAVSIEDVDSKGQVNSKWSIDETGFIHSLFTIHHLLASLLTSSL